MSHYQHDHFEVDPEDYFDRARDEAREGLPDGPPWEGDPRYDPGAITEERELSGYYDEEIYGRE